MSATPSATRSYAERHPLRIPPAVLGRTGYVVSPVGFGSYRIHDQAAEHREALRTALLSGCNLIDTSANYGDGGSERLIGRVLAELIAEGKLRRDEVVLVSKAGYVQGENLRQARSRAAAGQPYPEMVEFSSDCWHNLSPEFLKDQLSRSLERLGLEKLDVLLLHNPEYFLKAGGDHAEYYRRIEAAFRHLESEADAGRISWYGVSSNTFPEPREAPDYTSLEVLLEIAERIRPDHRFAVIQFPMNLLEPGAALEENNGGRTVAQLALEKGLGTLVNRPLNAFSGNRLVRLADFPSHADRDIAGDFKEAMTRATALEARYVELAGAKPPVAAREIAWGHVLRHNFERLSDLDSWRGFLHYRVLPALNPALDALDRRPELRQWAADYRQAAQALFGSFEAYLEEQASVVADKIAGKLDHLCPELLDSATLSQKVIRLYLSIPGIDCVLVGMRQNRYVRDALDLKPAINPESARQALIEYSKEVAFL